MPATKDMVKVIGLLRRKPGMTREQCEDHWVNIHAPMSADIPVLRRYVLNLVVAEPTRSDVPSMGIEGGVDGIAGIWFAATPTRLREQVVGGSGGVMRLPHREVSRCARRPLAGRIASRPAPVGRRRPAPGSTPACLRHRAAMAVGC